jgi:hypothetical protein
MTGLLKSAAGGVICVSTSIELTFGGKVRKGIFCDLVVLSGFGFYVQSDQKGRGGFQKEVFCVRVVTQTTTVLREYCLESGYYYYLSPSPPYTTNSTRKLLKETRW